MAKEVRPRQEDRSCAICERSILKGERTENYLAPGGQRHLVCELCGPRASAGGWLRESGHGGLPATRMRSEPRRQRFRLRRGSRDRSEGAPPEGGPVERGPAARDRDAADESEVDATARPEQVAKAPRSRADPRKQARHVRAVPTTAEVKVERALDLFNASEHPRTIAGVARTLGAPWASAYPVVDAPSEVVVLVAWELSWYRYRVDLGDEEDPVTLLDKGEELAEVDEAQREWNAGADAEGRLFLGVGSGA